MVEEKVVQTTNAVLQRAKLKAAQGAHSLRHAFVLAAR